MNASATFSKDAGWIEGRPAFLPARAFHYSLNVYVFRG